MQLASFPQMIPVRQKFGAGSVVDVRTRIQEGLPVVLGHVARGARIAIAVGSRGISEIGVLARSTAEVLRALGAKPFMIPAMGSHGGGTSEGQVALLADYGITPESMGLEFESSMDTRVLGTTISGNEVFCADAAVNADGIVLINRVKPHTDFTGAVGSGLLKMMVVGLGKRNGAAAYHANANRLGYEQALREAAKVVLAKAPVLAGVAVIEDQHHHIAEVACLRAGDIEAQEPVLCARAGARIPRLPLRQIDLLIVDRIGKNISGTGMDPAVIGRSIHGYSLLPMSGAQDPQVRRLLVRGLTNESHGNAIGIGMADLTTSRLLRAVDWKVTYINSMTSLALQGAKLPIHFETDREAIAAGLATLALPQGAEPVVVRIADTLALDSFELSPTALAAVDSGSLEAVGEASEMSFDERGGLAGLRTV